MQKIFYYFLWKKTVSLTVFFEGAIISYVIKAHFIKKVSLSVFLEGAIISYVTKAHFMKNSLSQCIF